MQKRMGPVAALLKLKTLNDNSYNIPSLTFVSLGSNYLEGTLSNNVKNLKNVGMFNICCNNLSGKIPEEVGEANWIGVGGNHFTQTIPEGYRYNKYGWKVDEVWGFASQKYNNAPRDRNDDGTDPGYSIDELYYFLPMPDWAKERFGTWKWNQVDQKKPKYPYADDLQYPANEYYYDGKDWRHPKYEYPARFYHKVNGEWTYDPDFDWNHTTDPPITEVPEWPGVNRQD